MKSDANPMDPTQRLRHAPRVQGSAANVLLSKDGTSAACTALVAARRQGCGEMD